MRLRIKIEKTYQACLCKFFCFKAPGLKEQRTAFTGRESRAQPKVNFGDYTVELTTFMAVGFLFFINKTNEKESEMSSD